MIPGDASSIVCKIVDPVVVIPEKDSKIASVKPSPRSEKTKGNAPNIPDKIHAKFVKRKASFSPRFSSFLFLFVSQSEIPIKHEIREAEANPNQFSDRYTISINIGISIVNDKIVRSTPRIEKTGAIFISAISLSQSSYSQNISR